MDNQTTQSPKKYSLILADCPWTYDNQQQNDPARGGITYPTLSMEDLANLPIYKAANDNAILVFWMTFPKLMDIYYERYNPITVVYSWGFRTVTALFVWVKLNKSAKIKFDDYAGEYISLDSLYSGLGRYTNSNAEIAVVARKGKGLPRIQRNVKQLIFSPIRAHSEKPPEQYDRLDRLYGDVPRIELFARKQNPPPIGWNATGLDFDGVDIREWIRQYA